jgi:hypothetical protein
VTDLEAAMAAGGKPVQSDYEAALAAGAQEAPEQQEPGRLEALGRGALQGATFGFADEAQGALESIFTDKTYQQARDAARAANARAQAAHGGFYGAGEIGGGIASAFVPGLNIAEGAGLGTVAAKSALAGGLGGLGGSEATSVEGLAKDVGAGALEGGVGGAVAHGVGQGLSKVLGGADKKIETDALKGIAGAEGKAGASTAATQKLMDAKEARALLHEPIEPGKPGTLIDLAHGSAEDTKPAIKALQEKVGREELDPIYAKHDEATGGIRVSDLVKHYDEEIADLSKSPVNESYVKSLEQTRDSVIKAWAPKMADELDRRQAPGLSSVRDAIIAKFDEKVPASKVRSLATELQDRGASDVANPQLGTQVKQYLGSTTKDFVNNRVEEALGPADRAALERSNARMSSLYAMLRAVEEREPKEFGNKLNAQGAGSKVLGGLGMLGGMVLAPHSIPGAVAAVAAPKVIDQLPKLGRYATTQAAKANQVLEQIVAAAKQGSPWAQAQVNALRRTPIGAARLAQVIGQTVAAPVDQDAAEAQ